MTTLDQALRLWRLGFNVLPVPCPDDRYDGKVPAVSWKRWQSVRQTETDVRDLFGNVASNLAVVTGAVSGIVVVDADSPAACCWLTRHLPYSPWQVRTSRGYHVYYRYPGSPIRNAAKIETSDGKLAIDVRGDGGYVIGPGSIHRSGVEYAEAGDWSTPPDRVARFWPGWIAKLKPHSTGASKALSPTRPTGDLTDRAHRYLASIPRPEIGAGSDQATLYAACRLVRGFGLSEAEAESLLWEWCGGRPGWTRAWVAQKVRSALRYGTEPVGALR